MTDIALFEIDSAPAIDSVGKISRSLDELLKMMGSLSRGGSDEFKRLAESVRTNAENIRGQVRSSAEVLKQATLDIIANDVVYGVKKLSLVRDLNADLNQRFQTFATQQLALNKGLTVAQLQLWKDAGATLSREQSKFLKDAVDKLKAEELAHKNFMQEVTVAYANYTKQRQVLQDGLHADLLRDELDYQARVVNLARGLEADRLKDEVDYQNRRKALIEGFQSDILRDEVEYQSRVSKIAQGLESDRLRDEVEFQNRRKAIIEGFQADLLRDEVEYQTRVAAIAKGLEADKLKDEVEYQNRRKAVVEGYQADLLRDEVDFQNKLAILAKGLDADKVRDEVEYQKRMQILEEGFHADMLREEVHYQNQIVTARRVAAAEAAASLAKAEAAAIASGNAMHRGTVGATALSNGFRKLTIDGNDVHSAMRGLASGFNLLWLTWGNLIPLFAGAALSNAFMQALKTGAKVAENLSVIQHLGGATAGEMEVLNKAILDLGYSTQFGPVATSEALKVLSLAGLDATKSLAALRPTLEFSVAGEMPIQKAAEGLIAISSAFGYSAAGMSTVADVIAKTAAVSMASTEGMTESFRAASVVAQQYGVDLNDAAINLAFLSQIGIKGTAAGTAMKNMYTELVSGSRKSAVALKELGIATLDMQTGAVRPFVEILSELDTALRKKDATAQQSYLRDLANNRGSKDLVAALQAYRTKVYEVNDETTKRIDLLKQEGKAEEAKRLEQELSITAYQKLKQQMADAPGFVSIASAERSLSPTQQFEGVKSVLTTDLTQAFNSVQDSLFILGNTLKTLFTSKEFVEGLKNAVQLVTSFTNALVEHIGVVLKVVEALVAYKAITLAFAAFAAIPPLVYAVNVALDMFLVNTFAAAKLSSTLAAELGIMAVAANTTAVSMVGLQRAMGWIGAILTAAGLAWMYFSSKEKSAAEQSATLHQANMLRNAEFNKSIDASIKSYEDRAKARKEGITAEELALKQEVAASEVRLELIHKDTQSNIENQIATLEAAKARVQGVDNSSKNVRAIYDKDIAAAKVQLSDAKIIAAYENNALQMKLGRLKELAAAQKAYDDEQAAKNRNRPIGGETRPEATLGTAYKTVQDQVTEILVKSLADRSKLMDYSHTQELSRLQDLNKNKLISDGDYANQVLVMSAKFEADKQTFLEAAQEQRTEAYKIDVVKAAESFNEQNVAELNAAKDSVAYKKWVTLAAQGLVSQLEVLRGAYEKWGLDNDLALAKSRENSFSEMSKATNKLRGDIVAVQKAYSEFNIKEQQHYDKVNRQASLDDQMRYASPEARAWLSATSAEHERLTTQIQALEKQTREATSAAEEFKGASMTDADQQQQYDDMLLSVKNLRTELTTIKDGAAGKILDAGARANLESAKKNIATMAGGIADSVETALTQGGEAGGKQLRAFLQKELLLKPFTIMLTGVLGSVLGGIGQVAGQSLGAAGLTDASGTGLTGGIIGGSVGYMGNALGLTGAGSFASGWAGASGAASLSGTLGAEATFTAATTAEGIGASAYSALASIGPAGWIALAVVAAYAVFHKEWISAESIGSATSKYDSTGKLVSSYNDGPMPGNADALKVVTGVAASYAGLAKSLGVIQAATDIRFVANTGREGKNPNFTLSATTGAGSYMTKTDNADLFGANEMSMTDANIKLEVSRVLLMSLQNSALPKSLQGVFDNIDVTKLDQSAIDTVLATAQSFADLHKQLQSLPFESIKDLSYSAYQGLVTFSGGMGNLGANLATYYDKFYDADEKRAQSIKNINAVMEAGAPQFHFDAATATRDYYESLVEGQEVTTEAGQKTYATLISIAGAFDAVNPAATIAAASINKVTESLQSTNTSLLLQLETAKGNLMAGAGVDVNNAEQVALYNSNVALTEQIKVLNDHTATLNTLTTTGKSLDDQYNKLIMSEKDYRLTQIVGMDAAEIAAYDYNKSVEALIASHNKAAAIASEAYSLETQLLQAQGDTAELRRRELELIDPNNRAIQRTIWALADVKTAQDAYNTSLSTAKSGLATATSAYNSASSAVDALQAEGTNAYLAAVSAETAAQAKLTELQLNAQIELANTANAAAKAMADLSAQLYEFINSTALAPTQNFSRVLAAALAGDQTAMGNLTGAATGAIGEAQSGSATQLDFIRSRAQILSQVASVAAIADLAGKKTKVVPSATDPIVAAQAELAAIKLEVAEALRVANAINAPLVSQQATLISRYTAALAVMTKASADMVAAAKVLSDIEKNTSNTVKTLAEFKEKLVIELTATAKSNIEKLITFVTNTDKLPADLLALALATSNSFDKTINYIVGTALTSDNKILALSAANEFIRTFTFLAGATISAEVKHIAFDAVTAFDRTINVLAGAKLTDTEYVAAFGAVTEASRTIKIIATSNMTDALMTQAFGVTTDVDRYVNLIAGSSLTGTLKAQAFGAGTEILRTVGLVAGSSMTDALKAQAFGLGTEINRVLSLIPGSSMTDALKAQAFGAGTEITRAIGLVAGSSMTDALKAQAFGIGTEILRVVSVAYGSSMTDALKEQAFGAGTEIMRTVGLVAGSSMTDALKAQAFGLGTEINRVLSLIPGSSMTDALKAQAFGVGTEIIRTIGLTAGSSMTDTLKEQAFGIGTEILRVVSVAYGSSMTNELKAQAFGAGTEITRAIGLVAGSSMTDTLKTQAFGVGSAISRSVELLTGSTLTGTLKSQAFDVGTDLSRAVGLTAGSTLSGVLKAQAFDVGTDISRTISLLAGTNNLTADQQTLALSVSSAMTKTISSIASTTWLSATDAALAMAASETVTKTFKAALGTGDATAIAIAAAASDTVTRTIAASGGTLTADQKMILDAAVSGDTTVTVTTAGAVEWTPDLLTNMWLEGIFNATAGLWNAAGRGGDTGLLVKFARGTAAGESVWATGGAFTNGIVSSPTSFNMGLMGEAGPEAIMPLTNVGGSLGVRFAGDSANSALVSEIKSLREDNRAQALAIAQLNARMVKLLERWDGSGMPETRVTT